MNTIRTLPLLALSICACSSASTTLRDPHIDAGDARSASDADIGGDASDGGAPDAAPPGPAMCCTATYSHAGQGDAAHTFPCGSYGPMERVTCDGDASACVVQDSDGVNYAGTLSICSVCTTGSVVTAPSGVDCDPSGPMPWIGGVPGTTVCTCAPKTQCMALADASAECL